MKLYQTYLSPFAARCRLQLYAKGIAEVEFRPADEGRHYNPLAKTPILAVGHRIITESAVIGEYLEERFPCPALMPSDAYERARNRLIARVIDLYVYTPIRDLFRLWAAQKRNTADAASVMADLDQALGVLVATLRDGGYSGRYAQGDELSLADCALVPMLCLLNTLLPTFEGPIAVDALLSDYWEFIQNDPHCFRVIGEMTVELQRRQAA